MTITTLTLGLPLLLTGATDTSAVGNGDLRAPDSAATAAPAAPAKVARRRFDLSALRMARPSACVSQLRIPTLPLMRVMPGARHKNEGEVHEFDYSADVALVEIFSEHRQNELESIEFLSDSVVEIVGPPAVIDEFAALVQLMQGVVFQSTPVKVVRFEDDGSGPAGVVSIQTLDTHLASGAELRSRRTMQISGGEMSELHDLVGHDVVVGVEVQIAQGSAIPDAVTDEIASGMSLWARAAPTGRGLQLAYVLSANEHAEAQAQEASGDFVLSSEKGGLRTLKGFEWNEPFGLIGGTLAGDVELIPGEALVLSLGSMGEGHRHCVALCLPKGSPVSIEGSAAAIGAEHTLWAGPVGSTSVPSLTIGDDLGAAAVHGTELNTEAFHEDIAGVYLTGAESSFQERLQNYTQYSSYANIPGSALITVPNANLSKLRECVASTVADEAPRFNVSVSASTGDEPLSQLATLALRSGRIAALSAGSERLIADENEVEVAQFAGTHDPRIVTHFEGLRATLRLVHLPGGRLAYAVEGNLSTDLDEEELRIFGTEGLTAITSRVLVLDQRGTAARAKDGSWSILLGDESGQGQRVLLRVEPVK